MRTSILIHSNHGPGSGKNEEMGFTLIKLKPLNEDNVMEYVAATLHRPKPEIFPLGAVVLSKTGGNPFYIGEMLNACHRKNCIWYDIRECGWSFDLDSVFNKMSMENYNDSLRSDLVTSRLKELPATSKSILAWASMLGASFSFQLIQRLMNGEFAPGKQDRQLEDRTAFLLSYSEKDSVKGLQAAIQGYIIVPTQNDDIFRFANDQYIQVAKSLQNGNGNLMYFIMAQTLLKHYSDDSKYRSITASSIYESISTIKSFVPNRQPFRKVLLDYAHKACESGVRSSAAKLYTSCIALLQDDMWNNEANDVSYEETLQIYTAAAECYLYRGQYQEARRLLMAIFSNAKTAIDKAPSWILQSRLFAQEGDSSSAFSVIEGMPHILGNRGG